MSSTSNAQDLLVNVFRPTYRWDSNTGFVPSLTISNVSEIITGSIKTDLLVVSDTGNNTYIGSNAGLYASNTSYNVGLGYQAMGGAINSSNNVAVGYYALDGAKNSTSNVVLGSYSGLTNSNGGVRNVLIGPNVTVGTGSGNILIGSDISLASGTNRFQLGKLLYGDLSSGFIGVNTDDPKSAFDVSGTTLIRGKLGIQTVPNPKYSLDVNGSIFANDRFFGGKGTVAEPVYSFDDVSASGMYVPQASEGYGNGAFAIAVNQKPAAIFSSNAVNFFQNLDVSGTFSACNVELAAFSVEAGSRSAPTITFASNRADGFYHLADTSGFAVVTMGQDRMMFLESGDISSSRILGSDISLAGAIFTTAGCNVVGGVTLSNGNVILTGTATNSNLLVPGWIRNNETVPTVDISGGAVRAINFRAQNGTATAPAYSFLNDSSSGMHLVTRGTIAFDTSGTQRMCISAGFVGIGTANPRVALEVVGDVSATTYNGPGGTAGAPHYTFSDDRTTGVFFPGANMIGMTAGGTERMRISNGFVGIGTTPSASSALDVSGVFRIIGRNGNITFDNGTIDVSGTPLVSTTGAFSNATTTSNVIGGVTMSNAAVRYGYSTDTFLLAGGVNEGSPSLASSPTGSTWTSQGSAGSIGSSLRGLAWGGSRWVAVGAGTDSISTTTDPDGASANWTGLGATMFPTGEGVAWNGSLWVAVGSGGASHSIATSPNGTTWTGRGKTALTTAGYGVAWNGSLWVAVGQGTNTFATSTDGVTWTGRGGTTILSSGRAVAWNGRLWVAVGSGTFSIATSTDGLSWTGVSGSSALVGTLNCVAWNGSQWIAGGNGGGTNNYVTSSDGVTWTGASTTVLTNINGIAWNGTQWVAAGNGSNRLATFSGVTWTGVAGSSIFYTGGLAIASRRHVLPIVSSLVDASNGTILYTGALVGSNTAAVNQIGGVTLSAGAITNSGSTQSSNFRGLNGSATVPTYAFTNDPSTGLHWSGVSQLAFDTSGVQRMCISGGFVGIATATPATALDVSGTIRSINFRGLNGSATVPTYGFTNDPSTGLHWSGVSQIAFDTSGIQRMCISGGNVGIATATPTSALDVSGTTRSVNFRGSNGTVAAPTYSFINEPSTGIHWSGASQIAFDTAGVQRMCISNESVGIGTSNPAYTLDVSGSIRGTTNIRLTSRLPAITVMAGEGANTLAYSLDGGTTWVGLGKTIFSTVGLCVAWNGTMWLAGGTGTNSLAYSYDGINWTGLGTSALTIVRGLAWGFDPFDTGYWWAIGDGATSSVASSYDGITWTQYSSTVFNGGGDDIVYTGGGTFLAVGNDTNIGGRAVLSYYDSWQVSGSSIGGYGTSIAWSPTQSRAVFTAVTGTADRVYYNYQGENTATTITNGGYGRSVAWNGTSWMVGASGTSNIFTSTDGITWTGQAASGNNLGTVSSLLWTGTSWIAGGSSIGATKIATSTNGTTWTSRDTGAIFTAVYGAATTAIVPNTMDYTFANITSGNLGTVETAAFIGRDLTSNRIGGVTLSNSNVGIGMSNPIWSLDISGSGVRKIQVSGQDAAVNVWDQRVANPAVLFQNALNYGIYSSNALPFWLWQSNRVGLSISGGCVGIGTTLPLGGFDISYASTTFPSFRVTNVPLPTQGWGGLNRHTVDISGGMRIVQDASLAGPTDNDPRAMSDTLTLQSHRGQGSNGSASIVFRSGRDNNFYGRIYGIDRQPIPGNAFIGDLVFQTANGVGLPEVMRMTWDSRVGIRTIGPATTLDVSHDGSNDTVGFRLTATRGVGIALNISNGSKSLDLGIASSNGAWSSSSISGDAVLRTTGPGRLLFNANGVGGRAAITISGDKVGIGCINTDSPTGLLHLDISGAARLGRPINGNNNLLFFADSASGVPLNRHGIGMANVSTGSGNGGNDLAFNTYDDAGQALITSPPAMLIKRSNGNVGILCNAPQYTLDVSGTIGAHSNEYTVYVTSDLGVTAFPTGFTKLHATAVGGGGGGGAGSASAGGGGGGGGFRVEHLFIGHTTYGPVNIGTGGTAGNPGVASYVGISGGLFNMTANGGLAGAAGSGGTGGAGGNGGFGGGGGGKLSGSGTNGANGTGKEGDGAGGTNQYAGYGGGSSISSAGASSATVAGGGGGGGPGGGRGGWANRLGGEAGGAGGGGGGGASGGAGGAGGNGYVILRFLR